MNTRLRIICILFCVAYLFVIGDTVYEVISVELSSTEEDRDNRQIGYEYGRKATQGEALNVWIGVFLPAIGMLVVALTIVGLFVYIPVKTYRIIRSVIKDNLFDLKNIQRIRMVGYALLLIFVLSLIFYPLANNFYVNILKSTSIVEMESIRDEYHLLLMGLLVLLFAEIMKISHKIKEENELTV